MSKKSLLSWLILLLCSIETSLAQTSGNAVRLSFEIKDASDHEPLANVACRVFTAEGEFYTYAIADNEGRLSVAVHRGDFLEFSFIGYAKLRKEAASYTPGKTNVVELAGQEVQLREIAITAPPISARSDTLVYNVASFAGRGDSHLEDVLKKLPGIKVADDGTVSYQGKAINRFYIEGKDLLGSSYNQATRNMPVEAVTAVEVLEKHQPVKMLQGRQLTDNAALNIRLDKEHKSRPFGEVEGGIGCSPAIWNNRLFLTQILGKSQLLVTGKMNNTGTDISDETKEHIDVTDVDAYEPVLSGILSPFLNTETLPQNRYLHNNSYSLGVNYLTGLSENATLRMNVLFYEDRSDYSSSYDYTYGGTRDVNISEINNKRQKTLTVLPILRYELNSRKTYVADELRYSFNRSSSSNTLVSNGIGITENVNEKPHYLQNYLTASFSIGKQLVQAKSLLRYFERREALTDFSDSASFYNVHERYATRSFVAKNMLSTSVQRGKNCLDLGIRVYYRDNGYDYGSSVHHRKLQLRFRPSYTLLFGTDRTLSVELPVEWLHTGLAPATDNGDRGIFAFSPRLYFKYRLTDKWQMVMSASMTTDNTPAEFYSPGTLRTAYRTVYVPDNGAFFSNSRNINARLNYRDLATMFFANLTVSYTDEKRESYMNYDYTDSLTTVSSLKGDNHRRLLVANATADKSFISAGVTLKSGVSYNKTSYLLSQSDILIHNNSNTLAANLNTTFQKLKWLRATVGITGTLCWEQNGLYDSDALTALVTNASVYIFPLEKMDVRLMWQNYTNEVSESHFAACNIFDIAANYKVNKTWEIGASVTNLLDMRSYTVTQNSGINTSASVLPLRGREILFRVLFRI